MKKEIFIVHEPGYSGSIEYIDAIFDSFGAAEAFTKRFKENSEFVITARTVNPVYTRNREVSPYEIRFNNDEFEPFDINLIDFSLVDVEAERNEVFVHCEEGTNKLKQFEQCLYATSSEKAVAIVRKNRDDFLANRKLENLNIRMIVWQ